MMRHPVFGVSLSEVGWVPAPRYALRRSRLLRLLRPLPRGRLLEVGCGSGALLDDLSRLGFNCEAVETSESARHIARCIHGEGSPVRIYAAPQAGWSASFDWLLAFEVLEHIEEDAAALRQWHGWLRPGGRLVMSVPARMARWSPSDEWAGHFRRYERYAFAQTVTAAGFDVEHQECYGFPLSNLTETIRGWTHGAKLRAERRRGEAVQLADRTARSGSERSLETALWRWQAGWLGTRAFQALDWIQNLFLAWDVGTGYILIARRP